MTAVESSLRQSFDPHSKGPTSPQMTAGSSIEPVALSAIANVGQSHTGLSPSSTMDDLIALGNGEFNETAERAIREKIDEAVKLAPKRLLSSIVNLVRFVSELGIHYTKMRDIALDQLILLLETEPVNKESVEAIRKLIDILIESLDRNKIQGKSFEYQKKLACAFYLAIEHYLALYAKRQLGAITKETKDRLLKIVDDLNSLNKHDDVQLKNTLEICKEAIKRMKDDSSTSKDVLNAIVMLAEGVGGVFNKDPSSLVKNVAKLVDNLKAKRTNAWYDVYLAAKMIAQKALTNKEECLKLLAVMSSTLPCKNKYLVINYAELLAYIAKFTKDDEIRKIAIFCLRGENKETRVRASQLFSAFLGSGNPVIDHIIKENLSLQYLNHRLHSDFANDKKLFYLLKSLREKLELQKQFLLTLPMIELNTAVQQSPEIVSPSVVALSTPVSVTQEPNSPIFHLDDDPDQSQVELERKVAAEHSSNSHADQPSPTNVSIEFPDFHEDQPIVSSDQSEIESENKKTQSVASSVLGHLDSLPVTLTEATNNQIPSIQPALSESLPVQVSSASAVVNQVAVMLENPAEPEVLPSRENNADRSLNSVALPVISESGNNRPEFNIASTERHVQVIRPNKMDEKSLTICQVVFGVVVYVGGEMLFSIKSFIGMHKSLRRQDRAIIAK